MKDRIINLILRIFKNEKRKDSENDYFKLSKRFFSHLGLWYTQSDLRRKIGLAIFVVTQMTGIVPQVNRIKFIPIY